MQMCSRKANGRTCECAVDRFGAPIQLVGLMERASWPRRWCSGQSAEAVRKPCEHGWPAHRAATKLNLAPKAIYAQFACFAILAKICICVPLSWQ